MRRLNCDFDGSNVYILCYLRNRYSVLPTDFYYMTMRKNSYYIRKKCFCCQFTYLWWVMSDRKNLNEFQISIHNSFRVFHCVISILDLSKMKVIVIITTIPVILLTWSKSDAHCFQVG